MFRTLLKKQLLELNSFYFIDRKTGKRRTRRRTVLATALFVTLFLFVAASFAVVSVSLLPLLETDVPWLYYCYMGLMALLMGTVGSAFNTYAGLYKAKDNDLLLSMPIKPGVILLVRLTGVFLMGLLYESLILVPAVALRLLQPGVTFMNVFGGIVLWLLMAVLVAALSALLGYLVALISSKIKTKRKSAVTVALSLIFFVAYYALISQANEFMTTLVLNSEQYGASIRAWAYPLYLMGMAGEGHGLQLLLWAAIVLGLAALTWLLMKRSFLQLNLAKESGPKEAYREESIRAADVEKALLRRERMRLLGSPTYLLNAGIGIFIMPLAGAAAVIIAPRMRQALPALPPEFIQLLPTLVAAACCMVAGTVCITAASVSMEGKNIWILQTLPAPTGKVLMAKVRLQLVFAAPAALLMLAGFSWALQLRWTDAVIAAAFVVCFVQLSAMAGLCVNLKLPNLTWTNETVAVKQSMSVGLCLFGAWAAAIIFGLLGYLTRDLLPGTNYLLVGIVVLALATRLLRRWLREKGERIFVTLH